MMNVEQAVRRLALAADRPLFLMLIGVQGSGKSSFVAALQAARAEAGLLPIAVASSDALLEARAAALGLGYSEALGDRRVNKRHIDRDFRAAIRLALAESRDLVVDRPNALREKRERLLAQVPAPYRRIALCLQLERQALIARLQARSRGTGKIIPVGWALGLAKRLEAPSPEEGWDDILDVDNNAPR